MTDAQPSIDAPTFFRALVGHFYEGVADDPVLRPMYPTDLAPAAERLALFLLQYFTGDRSYDALRGEPRLRMRHMRFTIDRAARDAWIAHMDTALVATVADGFAVPTDDLDAMREYFDQTATFLMNSGGLTISGR